MLRFLLLTISVLLVATSFSVTITPMLITQNGIETDTLITQKLFAIKDFQFNVGFNLKRFGFDVGYKTPFLFKGLIIHAGIYHRWEDLNRQFLPAFGIGISINF
jgi:hypothetical protein